MLNQSFLNVTEGLSWYPRWISHQIECQPKQMYSVIPSYDSAKPSAWMSDFEQIWLEVCNRAAMPDASINSITQYLTQQGLLLIADDGMSSYYAKNLVLAVLGWQTMLFKPDMGTCNMYELAIAEAADGNQLSGQMNLRQGVSSSGRPLHEFLHGFGLMLPARNFFPYDAEDDNVALKNIHTISSASFNAKFLSTIGEITIKWTDMLACHLDLDTSSNTLYVFQYPSFCMASLHDDQSEKTKSTLYACGSTNMAIPYWAKKEDITEILRETLLSYRLLFGQNKDSRQCFHFLKPHYDAIGEGADKILIALCSKKKFTLPPGIRQSEIYDLRKDFPILRYKIALLSQRLSRNRPRTWKQMWNDRRDSPNWYTFWALLVFGGTGIMLAFFQLVLQIIELSLKT